MNPYLFANLFWTERSHYKLLCSIKITLMDNGTYCKIKIPHGSYNSTIKSLENKYNSYYLLVL